MEHLFVKPAMNYVWEHAKELALELDSIVNVAKKKKN